VTLISGVCPAAASGIAAGMSEPYDHSVPDAAETDPAALNSSEDLDEDRLRVDPLEAGVEPPERYAHSDRFGTTPSEVYEGEPLDERLRQERPDVQPEEVPERPLAATPDEQLDDSVDDERAEANLPSPEELVGQGRGPSVEDQNADKAGGSVAEAIRTPGEPS
jgi:hypothetical protein